MMIISTFVSAYCAKEFQGDFPSVKLMAYKADFTRHHCKNISPDLMVLFTGDSNNVLIMNSAFTISAGICKYPETIDKDLIEPNGNKLFRQNDRQAIIRRLADMINAIGTWGKIGGKRL